MAIYSRKLTAPASSTQEYEIELEGDVITFVRLRFPPGPQGLLKVSVLYGIHQLFPHEADTYFAGDDEIIEWQEYWPLPERITKIRVKVQNDDDTYEHSCYLVLNVQDREEMLATQIANAVRSAIRRIFGFI